MLNEWNVVGQQVNGPYHHFSEAEAEGKEQKEEGAENEDDGRPIGRQCPLVADG